MPITTLDPQTALVVIDLQKGLVGNPLLIRPVGEIIAATASLADAFRAAGLPVVLAALDGGQPGRNDYARPARPQPDGFTEIVPELGPQPGDILISKSTWGAFIGTGLAETLRDLGVTQVVIAGIATSFGVESTARQAYDLGFHVTLATDAMTDMSDEAQTGSTTRVFPALGETGTTAEIIAVLDAR
jgi:nicotinamidase-related amidase